MHVEWYVNFNVQKLFSVIFDLQMSKKIGIVNPSKGFFKIFILQFIGISFDKALNADFQQTIFYIKWERSRLWSVHDAASDAVKIFKRQVMDVYQIRPIPSFSSTVLWPCKSLHFDFLPSCIIHSTPPAFEKAHFLNIVFKCFSSD